MIHDFYSREVPNPVHLTVDTGFLNGEGTIKAYVSVNLALGDRQLAAQFQEIPLDLRMVEAERVGCMYTLNYIYTILFPLRYCLFSLSLSKNTHVCVRACLNTYSHPWLYACVRRLVAAIGRST